MQGSTGNHLAHERRGLAWRRRAAIGRSTHMQIRATHPGTRFGRFSFSLTLVGLMLASLLGLGRLSGDTVAAPVEVLGNRGVRRPLLR
jgi:hypothetical protein